MKFIVELIGIDEPEDLGFETLEDIQDDLGQMLSNIYGIEISVEEL